MNCRLAAVGVSFAVFASGALPAPAGARTHLVWVGGTPSFQKALHARYQAESTTTSPTR